MPSTNPYSAPAPGTQSNVAPHLFTGGTSWIAPPGWNDVFNSLNFNNLDPGLGAGGQMGKSILKNISKGNFDSNPVISGFFNPVRNAYATNARDMTRQAQLNSGVATGPQIGLLNEQSQNALAKSGDQMGMTEASMVPAITEMGNQMYQQGRQQRIQAQDFGITGQENLLGLEKPESSPSFLQDAMGIAQLGGAIAGDVMGFGAGGLGGAGGLVPGGAGGAANPNAGFNTGSSGSDGGDGSDSMYAMPGAPGMDTPPMGLDPSLMPAGWGTPAWQIPGAAANPYAAYGARV